MPSHDVHDIVASVLRAQLDELHAADARDQPALVDGVHAMRVALRRLRSTLAAFRHLLDDEVVVPLRRELAWVAGELGPLRDVDVLRARLDAKLAAEPADLVARETRDSFDRVFAAMGSGALKRASEALASERYRHLLDELMAWDEAPPFIVDTSGSADELVEELARVELARVGTKSRKARRATTSAVADERWHALRKVVKRARYVTEALGQDDKAARRLAQSLKRLQTLLGERQDSVVARELLRRLAADRQGDPRSAFTYGRLDAREQAARADVDRRLPKALRRVKRAGRALTAETAA